MNVGLQARKNLHSWLSRYIRHLSVIFCPVFASALFAHFDFVWRRIISVDGETAVVDSLGVQCRKQHKEKSEKKKSGAAHKLVNVCGNHSCSELRT